ncbi:bifunctional precorrin-2 dehydrogenase/sirohydrochlorin ferrochelatase [Paenibacillus sp. NEAU-GSW1]|uniref:precorrin-2 dehydrogenase/sirohydrochlorin ferrochelatase family protein n=1 Tax=Paenibacillus sp. NEAU-GSW1 TaxID=2682486 RepID=UPI0012E311EE|nr:bifunctional precorrin-2 dehydrogenase/sirohydrochlorin ferrochelatase [Paenibacillus sp. NEAU-GSW1]MUT64510.1 bifunctional precorrin-2 dehydrogenase/sirohydrochlorin ferrochelatase [Paenibacillus sp. NEAU-GSW1]
MNGFFPVMLQLRGERVVVVGGGRVAERKTLSLLEAGADDVLLISPMLTPRLRALANEAMIRTLEREYIIEDIAGARLVFAAADSPELNGKVAEDGRRIGAWVNTADDASRSSFVSPSVVRRGDLLIAVSALGASPALSMRIKRELEERYGPEYGKAAERLRRLRERTKSVIKDAAERETLLRLAAAEAPHFKMEEDDEAWLARLRKLITEG